MKVRLVKKGTMKPMQPFKTLEEEANFWDKHDAIEILGNNIIVGTHKVPKTDTITIRFQPEHIQILKEKALQLGLGPTTLARMWILEKLQSSK